MNLRTTALLAISAAMIVANKPATPRVATPKAVAAKDLLTSVHIAVQTTTGHSLNTLASLPTSNKNKDERLEHASGGNDYDRDKDRDEDCKNKHRPSESHDCRRSVSPD